MTLCKNCGTVYDEFYGVCPRCGTPCQNASDTSVSPLPPLGGMSPTPDHTPVQSPLPPIDIAIRNTGESGGAPVTMPPLGQSFPLQQSIDPDAAIPVQRTFDPDATIPVQRPFDPDATIPVQRTFDPDATVPVQRPVDPDATVPVQRPFDPDATVPVQRTFDPDATIPVQRPFDPDATVPVQRPVDPDATVPVQRPFDPDATIPVQRTFDPDATVPITRTPIQPPMPAPVNPTYQTQEIPPIGNTNPGQYGDDYNVPVSRSVSPSQPPKKSGSAGKIIAIILIVAVVLGGCGVGAYFLFFHNKNHPQEASSQNENSTVSTVSDASAPDNSVEESSQPESSVEESSQPESSVEESSQPESSVEESSQPESSAEPDIRQQKTNAALLNSAYKTLYSDVISGTLNRGLPTSQRHGISASKLPPASASAETRKSMADVLTIADAIRYDELGNTFTEDNIGEYVYADEQIFYHAEREGTPLTMDTTLGEMLITVDPEPTDSKPESSREESSRPESSKEESSRPESSREESSRPESSREESSRPESSREESSQPESSADVSTTVNDPRMAELAGKWSMTYNTEKYTPAQLKEYISKEYDEFVILLQANGTCSSYFVKDGTTDVLGSGTWEVQDTLVSVTIDGGTEKFSYRDGRLYTTAWGDIAYFSKG